MRLRGLYFYGAYIQSYQIVLMLMNHAHIEISFIHNEHKGSTICNDFKL